MEEGVRPQTGGHPVEALEGGTLLMRASVLLAVSAANRLVRRRKIVLHACVHSNGFNIGPKQRGALGLWDRWH